MKRLAIIYIVLIVAVIALAILQRGSIASLFGGSSSVSINGKTYKVTIAKTEKDKMIGLSGRNSLGTNNGMLFPYDQKGKYRFWMSGMKFPIDIIYISDDKIVDIINNAPAPSADADITTLPVYQPSNEANYVLEVNAGEALKNNFKQGDTVTFKDVKK